jgi:putative peptidoglycan lipid II flippase
VSAIPEASCRDREPDSDGGALAKNSLAVVFWTIVSRTSGFIRVAVIAAVLGPTYVGNIFQATNSLPNLTYAALTGSLFSTLLVPPLVRHLDTGDRRATDRLARAFLSIALALFAVVAAVIVLAGPLAMRLLSVGVADPATAALQRRTGYALLIMFMPQLLMYTVVGTAEAVMNAHGRFALASAAPAIENVGIIATMTATALIYGTGNVLAAPTNSQLLLLGLGTTSAVAFHAAVQWWGARRVGVTLLPGRGWREPEIRSVMRRALPSLGYSTLEIVQPLGAIVVANRVAGGVVAFQFANNLYALPYALGTRPVAVALLPRLSRLYHLREIRPFRDELVRGASLVAFLAVPAGIAFMVLAMPIAAAVTFGRMATGQGHVLLALSIASLGPGVIGGAAMMLGTYACYACNDATTPLRAVLLRAGVAVVGMSLAFAVPAGGGALFILGLTTSVAALVGGFWLAVRLRRRLPSGRTPLRRPLLRTVVASVLMAGPAYLVADQLPELLPPGSGRIAIVVAAVTGTAIFLFVHTLWRSPELAQLAAGLRQLRVREVRAGRHRRRMARTRSGADQPADGQVSVMSERSERINRHSPIEPHGDMSERSEVAT